MGAPCLIRRSWGHGPASIRLEAKVETAGIDARGRLCNFFHRRVQTPRNDGQGKAEALEAFGSFMLRIRLISMRIVGAELSSFHCGRRSKQRAPGGRRLTVSRGTEAARTESGPAELILHAA